MRCGRRRSACKLAVQGFRRSDAPERGVLTSWPKIESWRCAERPGGLHASAARRRRAAGRGPRPDGRLAHLRRRHQDARCRPGRRCRRTGCAAPSSSTAAPSGASSYYMTWADVDALNADGNEIGGHTVDHKRLTDLTADQQRHEICDDAATLRAHGYTVNDFAYPYGAGSTSSAVQPGAHRLRLPLGAQVRRPLQRGLHGSDCPFAESIPAGRPYGVGRRSGMPASTRLRISRAG